MSLVGKKVDVLVLGMNEKGEFDETKNVSYSGVVLDKVLNGFPNPANPNSHIQCDNYVIQKDSGEIEVIHPSFLSKVM